MTYKYNNVYIKDSYTIAGMYESDGPLRKYFDKRYEDDLYFNSMKECSEHYGYNVNSFRYALKTNEDGLHKGRHFCLIENIDKNKKLKNKQLKMDNIYQYTKNYELVNIYHGADNLPSDYRYASIVKGCIGSRKTVYGYIWSYKEINHLESA